MGFDAYRFSISWSRIFPSIYDHTQFLMCFFSSLFFMKGTYVVSYQKLVIRVHTILYQFSLHKNSNAISFYSTHYIFQYNSFCCFDTEGTGEINLEGVEYYNNLINYSLKQGNSSNYCHSKLNTSPSKNQPAALEITAWHQTGNIRYLSCTIPICI